VRLERRWAVIFTIRTGSVVRLMRSGPARRLSQPPDCELDQGRKFRRRIAERAIRTRRRWRRMIVQVVKYKSGLSDDEVRRVIAERAPRYEALPRLRQKLYIREPETGEYGGIYVWDDEESMREFRESDLAETIPAAYRVEGEPRVEIFELVSVLRAEEGVVPAGRGR
jgi:hypothetical protein